MSKYKKCKMETSKDRLNTLEALLVNWLMEGQLEHLYSNRENIAMLLRVAKRLMEAEDKFYCIREDSFGRYPCWSCQGPGKLESVLVEVARGELLVEELHG